MPYTLKNAHLAQRGALVVLVGCGGTGGFVAEGLARLFLALGRQDIRLVLVDHDTVEERNLLRQNFLRDDLGRYKAQALAERLARQYGQPVGYSLEPVLSDGHGSDIPRGAALVIGAVDNHLARAGLAWHVRPPSDYASGSWWVDAGNAESFGQVVIGNADSDELEGAFDEPTGICYKLPKPTVQVPELLAPPLPEVLDPNDPSCAVLVEMGQQSPVINQMMAALVLEVVRQLLLGKLQWMRVDLDLERGEMRPLYATPENAAKAAGLRVRQLLAKAKKTEERR